MALEQHILPSAAKANPQGNQLRRDLNVIVGQGRNWKIPFFLPFLWRYVSGPVLAIIFSFAFPEFHTLRYDPMMVAGFILSILTLVAMIIGFVIPRYYAVFISPERRNEGTEPTTANELKLEPAESVSVDSRFSIERDVVEPKLEDK